MAQQVKVPATEPDGLGLVTGSHTVGENRLQPIDLPFHALGHAYPLTQPIKIRRNKNLFKILIIENGLETESSEGQMRKSPKQRLPQGIFCLDSVLLKICLRSWCEGEKGGLGCTRAPTGQGQLKDNTKKASPGEQRRAVTVQSLGLVS